MSEIRAARGTAYTALGWPQEAAKRMLMNNLDPDVAERPQDLVVYGGTGKAARDWPSFHAIVRELDRLRDDETLLVQSGKPVGVFRTHEWAPRVLIANSNLVGDWATWPEFRRLEKLGLTMYGQMTAGSWIYIGTQGILQGTYETFAAVAAKRFSGSLAGTLTLTAGCGGMGGAQPLAVTMNGGVCLIVDVDRTRLQRRVDTRYLDVIADDLDDAVSRAPSRPKSERSALSVGVVGNAAVVFPELRVRGVEIDIVTDQTSAHDPLSYIPVGVELSDAAEYAPDETGGVHRSCPGLDGPARGRDGRLPGRRRRGLRLRQLDPRRGQARPASTAPSRSPASCPAYIRPLFAEGKGPFRWAALSGDPADIAATDRAVLDLFPENEAARPLDPAGRRAGRVPGPAGPDLLARLRRAGQGRCPLQRHGGAAARSPRRS